MVKKYLFISNSNKPTREKARSRDVVKLGNVRRPSLDAANQLGYQIWVGVNRDNPEKLKSDAPYEVNFYDSHTYRNIFNLKDNYIAYRNLMNLLKKYDFDVIHCNTPIGGFLGRVCGRKAKVPKIIYTAHGFHFYKGAPLYQQVIIRSVEKLLARWTDVIITMNTEDYKAAKKFKLRNNGSVYKIPGVGIDTEMYKNIKVDKEAYREKLGLNAEDIICMSSGDLIKRKNYETSIRAVAKIDNPNLHYLICGKGPEEHRLKELTKELGVESRIHFLGYRTDIKELLKISDIFLFMSFQEGLPRSLMEAMASGLPCIASDIRGNRDLLDHMRDYLVEPKDICLTSDMIKELIEDDSSRLIQGQYNQEKIKKYDTKKVEELIKNIYFEELH